MKVLLLEDVPNVGRKFETHEVADGYGANYLIPRGLARVATDRLLAQFEKRRSEHFEKQQEKDKERAQSLSDLEGETVSISRKANEQGQLYSGIKASDIVQKISDDLELKVREDEINLSHALKEVGEHEVQVTIAETSATITLNVEQE